MSAVRLSIIIPTRNRQKYCLAAVRQITSLNLKDTEIIIQDNSDDNSLASELESEEMKRASVKYFYCPGEISFVDNFNMSVENSTGEYLCIIGDDDGILPNINTAVELMEENEYDALLPRIGINYIWPDNTDYSARESGELTIYRKVTFAPYVVDHEAALDVLLENAMLCYNIYNIPRIYHALVRRDCVEAIKEKTGAYFHGLSPDVYIAVALCYTCKKVVAVDFPITVSGVCKKSGTSDQKSGRHTGELKDAPHFRGHSNYEWNFDIPYIYTADTIWAETALRALNDFFPEKARIYPKKRLATIIYAEHPQFRKRISQYLEENAIPHRFIYFDGVKYNTKKKIRRSLVRINKLIFKKKRDTIYRGVQDIQDAVALSVQHV